MDKVLEVKKLKISFRTNNGTVKAVRDISFDLNRGETLAIVGESGSGKSVTSKAILGILAGNSIVEGGEILYDGKDLLTISEDDMYKIRGDKIAMIFQDPLSSLDPIVKIGKQITEGMILKNRDNRKNARKEFNTKLAILKANIIEALGEDKKQEVSSLCKEFDNFNIVALKLENSYNDSLIKAEESIELIKDFIFRSERKQKLDVNQEISRFTHKLDGIDDPFFTNNYVEKLASFSEKLNEIKNSFKSNISFKDKIKGMFKYVDNTVEVPPYIINVLNEYVSLLEELVAREKPNFFRIGYYKMKNPTEDLLAIDINELNEKALKYLDENFMLRFLDYVKSGLINAYKKSYEAKKVVLENTPALKEFFNKKEFDKASAKEQIKSIKKLVNDSINKLEVIKDSIAYTFAISLKKNVNNYFKSIKDNAKEEKRFTRQQAKYDKLVASGKKVDWKVIPQKIVDLDDIISNIVNVITRLEEKYKNDIATFDTIDYNKINVELIDYFKKEASLVVYKVTKTVAKEKAIKLMEEVGIPEPRIRYYQYPFEFSGGMRQRIVIAIALSADPDILICDEPTTALDVTIQSQILELINKIKKERNLSIIFITHDLGVVANMADRVAVMYAGKIVEYGTSEDIFYAPAHPYTWALLSSMPDLETKDKLEAIPGTPPNMIYPPKGDAFAERNKYAMKIDFEKQPPLFKISDSHYAATWLLHPSAPKVEMPKVIVDRINRMKAKQGGQPDGEQQ